MTQTYLHEVDISGTLNAISTRVLLNAAAAISGMARQYCEHPAWLSTGENETRDKHSGAKYIVAVTMFGLTTPGTLTAILLLVAPFTGRFRGDCCMPSAQGY